MCKRNTCFTMKYLLDNKYRIIGRGRKSTVFTKKCHPIWVMIFLLTKILAFIEQSVQETDTLKRGLRVKAHVMSEKVNHIFKIQNLHIKSQIKILNSAKGRHLKNPPIFPDCNEPYFHM